MAFRDCIVAARDGGELTREEADRILRRIDELTASGRSPEDTRQRVIAEMEADAEGRFLHVFEEQLDQGRSPVDAKAAVMAMVTSRELRERVAAKLDNTVVLEEPPPHALSPDQARQFAEVLAANPTNREKIEALQRITGDKSIGARTLQKIQKDLAERGLIDLRGGRKAAEQTGPAPEFDIPRLMKKQTRAAGKPVTGVFAASADLAWTGLPTGEFRANLRHIAEKRARKDVDPTYRAERGLPPPVGGDLSTPAKVEAHIGEVLASPSFAQVRHLDGQPRELVIVRLGAEGSDQIVGVSLHKSDGTGRMYIATAFNMRREDTIKRLAAALNQQGVGAVKMRKTREGLNELLTIVGEVPTDSRGPSWNDLTASLRREQVAVRERAINAASGRHRAFVTVGDDDMRSLAVEAIGAGATVHVAPRIRDAVNRAAVDVLDVVPASYRVGALEKIEPIRTDDGDAAVRATYRTPDGKTFSLDGDLEEFTATGALHDRDVKAIALNVFGARSFLAGHDTARNLGEGLGRELGGNASAPAAAVSFDLAMRGRIFHETLHALWRDLDALSQARLVAHSNRLGVLDKTFVEFNALAHFEPRGPAGDATDAITIREAYEDLGASTDIINQEAAAHMTQLAVVGAIEAKDLAPVRDILERLFNGDRQHMSRALDGAPPRSRLHAITDTEARAKARDAVGRGKAVYIPPAVRTAVTDAIGDMVDMAPEGVRSGVLAKVEPLEGGGARGVYRTIDGERFTIDGPVDHFLFGGFFDPDAQAIVLSAFNSRGLLPRDNLVGDAVKGLGGDLRQGSAPGTRGIPFDRAIRGIYLHELLHSMWDTLDDSVRARLVNHANDLEVLDLLFMDFLERTHWDPSQRTGGDRDQLSIRDIYAHFGADADALNQEAATHFLQLVAVGALRPEHVAPVRDILDNLFGAGRYTPKAPGGKPGQKTPGRAFALDPRRAEMERRRAEHLAWQLRQAEHLEQQWLKETAFMREGDGQPRNPADAMHYEAWQSRQIVEILESCRS